MIFIISIMELSKRYSLKNNTAEFIRSAVLGTPFYLVIVTVYTIFFNDKNMVIVNLNKNVKFFSL